MAQSEIMQKIEDLSEEREKLVARERSHHADAADYRRLDEIDHTLSVLWDLRRREMAGENVRLDEDFRTPLAQVRRLRPRSIGRTYTTSASALEYDPESEEVTEHE